MIFLQRDTKVTKNYPSTRKPLFLPLSEISPRDQETNYPSYAFRFLKSTTSLYLHRTCVLHCVTNFNLSKKIK